MWKIVVAAASGVAVGVAGTIGVQSLLEDEQVAQHKKRLAKAKKQAEEFGAPQAVLCDIWPENETMDLAIKVAKDKGLEEQVDSLTRAKKVRKEGNYAERVITAADFSKKLAEDDEASYEVAKDLAATQGSDPFEESKRKELKDESEQEKEEKEPASASTS